MENSPHPTQLGPCIKLLKRQLQEWKALLIHQRQVRRLTHEAINQQPTSNPVHKKAMLERMSKQGIRLSQLLERQTEEYQQMKVRHQQEEAELEQAIKTHTITHSN